VSRFARQRAQGLCGYGSCKRKSKTSLCTKHANAVKVHRMDAEGRRERKLGPDAARAEHATEVRNWRRVQLAIDSLARG
jgi:hypothetical protein